jgi:hypothetical protein
MHLKNVCNAKVIMSLLLPDEVRAIHLGHEKTEKVIPSYKELHLLELDSPRPLQD